MTNRELTDRADWLMPIIVRLIKPDIVSALRQVEAQARAEAIEEAARVAETMPDLTDHDNPTLSIMPSPEDIAAAIRALANKE